MVTKTLDVMCRNKAPGLDEWRVFEMRSWSEPMQAALAALHNIVEETCNWPETLAEPLGILSPKAAPAMSWTDGQYVYCP